MSSKIHAKAFRSIHWPNTYVISSTNKCYSNLWLRNLYLQIWLNRNQITGLNSSKKNVHSKSKTKNIMKWGPNSIKSSFSGIGITSWSQTIYPKNFRSKSF